LRPGGSLWALWAGWTLRPGGSLWALWAGRTLRPRGTLRSSRTDGPLRTGGPCRTLRASAVPVQGRRVTAARRVLRDHRDGPVLHARVDQSTRRWSDLCPCPSYDENRCQRGGDQPRSQRRSREESFPSHHSPFRTQRARQRAAPVPQCQSESALRRRQWATRPPGRSNSVNVARTRGGGSDLLSP